jgi:predicted dehydrogenase
MSVRDRILADTDPQERTRFMKLTRRELGRLAATGAASQLASAAMAQGDDRKIGYCPVGLGRVSDNFLRASKASKHARITGLVSGHRDKAEKIAAEYGVSAKNIYSYDNYDAIGDNKDIDAVYIGLPNSMHAEYTIRAAKAGKHVLCEKPMANTPADCQAMIDACRKAGKKLMLAYRCQYEPVVNLRAVELIRTGKLGKIQTIDTASGFNIRPGEWRLDGKLAGGGPLMDMGIYALNGCRYLTGEEPVEVKGVASVIDQDGRFKDVEENLMWTMKFPSGIVANCATSYGANLGTFFRVHGTKGMLLGEPAWGYEGLRLVTRIQGEQPTDEPNPERHPAQFVREADHFAECIFQNKEPKTPGEEGLRDVKLIAEIYRSCGRKV